jgi:hypothetical protein
LIKQHLNLGLHCLPDQLTGTRSQKFRQRVRNPGLRQQINNIILVHGGVSPFGCLDVLQQQFNQIRRLPSNQIYAQNSTGR